MYKVVIYLRVRKACFVEGMSVREAARVFGLHRDTVRKMLEYSVPPGYRRQRPARRPKLDPYKGVMDQILEQDLSSPKKQRHTAKRIYERLRDEHGFPGKYTIVKDYVRERRRHTREMFLPLSHPPGHAQCDYGEARVIIGGVERKAHYFALDLPHSDGCYVKAYPAETTESFCDGHVSAFAFLGGVPQSILYDNTTLAVARILGDGLRQRTRVFSELQSHYLFEDRFGRPGKGNDKGKVEGLVGYVRRNFLVPIPSFESFDALNAHLEQHCLRRFEDRLRGHNETIGERLERDLEKLLPLPAVPYDASDKHATRVSSLSLVRYRTNDYSVPVAYGHRDVLVRGYVHEVVISCGAEVIARHRRSYDRDDFVFDPLHYLPLLEKKTRALDQAAPLVGWELPEEFGVLRRLLESRMGKRGKREFVQVLRLMDEEIDGVAAEQRERLENIEAELIEVRRRLDRVWHIIENSELDISDATSRIREHRERQEKLEIAAEEARALLSERRAVLDNVDTIAAFAEDMSDFLMTSEITESRAFIKSFVKEIKVKPGKATVYYTLPTPPDSPIGGGDAAEVALHGPVVRSSVHVGGAEGTRTPDFLRAREALSQLSYSPTINIVGWVQAK